VKPSNIALIATTLVVTCAIAACGGSGPASPRNERGIALQIVSGNTQSGIAGEELADAVVVRVSDSSGQPVAGQIINFHVTAGNGTVFAGTALSDASGEARERWTLGPIAGQQRLEARAVDPATGAPIVFASFDATAVPGPVAEVLAEAGSTQFVPAGNTVAVRAKVADKNGNGVAGVSVDFVVTLGTGSVSPASVVTDSQGHAATNWTMGPEIIVQNLQASVEVAGVPAAIFQGGPIGGGSGY